MDLISKVKEFYLKKIKKDPSILAEEISQKAQEVYSNEDGEKKAIEEAGSQAFEEYINLVQKMGKEQQKELIKVLTDLLVKNEELPDQIAARFISQTIYKTEEDNVPNEEKIVQAGKLPDSEVEKLIGEQEDLKIKRGLIEALTDEELKSEKEDEITKEEKELIINSLKEIYDKCQEYNDRKLVSEVKKTKNNREEDIKDLIIKIVSKKIAINQIKYKGYTIPTLSDILPAEEMLENDIHLKTAEEYIKAGGEKEFDTKQLKTLIIREIGRQIGIKYENGEEIRIPQLKSINNLSQEEKGILIEEIKTGAGEKEVSKRIIKKVRNQLNGIIDIDDDIDELIELFQKMKSSEMTNIIGLIEQMSRNKGDLAAKIAVHQMIEEEGVADALKNITQKDSRKMIEIFGRTIIDREKKGRDDKER